MKIRLIDADKLIFDSSVGFIMAFPEFDDRTKNLMQIIHNHFQKNISKAPTVDAVPVRHGKWKNDEDFDYVPCCSICGEPDALSRNDYNYRGGKIRDNNSNYCPDCGAKMDRGDENA